MKYLLDTHSFLWWASGNLALPIPTRQIISERTSQSCISTVTVWEISIKVSIGKLPDPGLIEPLIARGRFNNLPIEFRHTELFKTLPLHHRDPFDRMLIAQALADDLTIISNETIFDAYGVKRVWD
jgi:PIN domain nuclease of toxin-antitoxin system